MRVNPMTPIVLWLCALMGQHSEADARAERINRLISDIRASGRVVELGEAPNRLRDPRRELAPGIPPVLAFRYFQGLDRHRFGNLDVMLDDAGH